MKNFSKVGTFDPTLALQELDLLNMWNWMSLRRLGNQSAHYDVDDIILRFHPVAQPLTPEQVFNSNDTVSYFPWFVLRNCAKLVEDCKPDGYVIGRVLVAKLKPLGAIGKHADEGGYADNHDRYHFVLSSNPQVTFVSGDEAVNMKAGEIWTFNNHIEHQVINLDPTQSRIHIIADYRKE